jgi:F-type H+-transporting ATPase subunit alpha
MFRLDYAQFLELELFTRFGSVPDARVQAQITRGERLRALLVQPQFVPLRLVDEVALALALREGLLDALPVKSLARLRQDLPDWLNRHAGPWCSTVECGGLLDDVEAAALRGVLESLVKANRNG